MSDDWLSRTYFKALLLVAGYALLAQAGTMLYAREAGASYFWPANALVFFVLSYSPMRQWPLLLLAVAATELFVDRYNAISLLTGVGLGLANALEAGCAAWLARRYIGQPVDLKSLKNLFRFICLVVLASPVLSAWLGAAALHYSGSAPDYWAAWNIWWRGDALGMLLVAPALLTLSELRSVKFSAMPPIRIVEALILVAGLILATPLWLGADLKIGAVAAGLPCLVYPFLVWAGLRFGIAGVAWASVVVAIETVWIMANGANPLVTAGSPVQDHVLAVQAFLAIAAATSLVLSTVVSERVRAQESLLLSEERLRTIGNIVPVLIGYYDQDLRFRLGNKTYEDWFRQPREARYGRTVRETEGEQVWEQIEGYVQKVRNGETVTFDRDMRPAGVDKDIEVTYIPHFSREGRVIGHYVLGVDVTERKHSVQALKELNDDLERRVSERTEELSASNQEFEAFAYTVAHDLRAPTRHIVGYSEMLKQRAGGVLDEESRRLLDTVVRSASRQAKLVEDLLNYLRVGQQAAKLHPLDLGALIHEVRAQLVTQDGSVARVEWQIDTIPLLLGDPVLLKQAFMNLLQNAIKFSRDAVPPRIEIHYAQLEPGVAAISIRDNGVGFDMRYKDKLFHVFQRLHAENEFPGTGVGLAIVRRAIEKQGGAVWAKGCPGKGSTFSFSLKRAQISA